VNVNGGGVREYTSQKKGETDHTSSTKGGRDHTKYKRSRNTRIRERHTYLLILIRMVEQVLVLNGADDHVYDYEEGVEQIGKCVDQDDRLRHTYL